MVKLGSLCTKIGSGATPRGGSKVYVSNGTAFVRSQNVYNEGFSSEGLVFIESGAANALNNVAVMEGDVLLNITGESVGRCCLFPKDIGPARVSQHVMIIRPDVKSLDNAYLRYWLISPSIQGDLAGFSAAGATRRALTKGMIEDLNINVPPLPEQRRIAAVLGALDDKIELNRKMNQTLEALAQALFKSWFVDFDGHDDLVESEIGPVPRGWEVGTLGQFVQFQNGYAFKSKDWQDEGIPVVKIGSVKPNIVDVENVSYVSEDVASSASRYRLDVGDILIGMTGYVGEVGRVPRVPVLPLLNQRVGRMVFGSIKEQELLYCFTYCLMRTQLFKEYVEKMSHGSAQANVSSKAILSFECARPVDGELMAFNNLIKPVLDRILIADEESRTLAELRDVLLPKLVSGELRVEEAEELVAEVV